MLREAVKNVLDNAVRHGRAGAGGSIVIRLFTDRTDATHCLSVSDGGPGIKEPHRARVFERFQRGSATEAPGSGLGLAIVKSVVDAHGRSEEHTADPQSLIRISDAVIRLQKNKQI